MNQIKILCLIAIGICASEAQAQTLGLLRNPEDDILGINGLNQSNNPRLSSNGLAFQPQLQQFSPSLPSFNPRLQNIDPRLLQSPQFGGVSPNFVPNALNFPRNFSPDLMNINTPVPTLVGPNGLPLQTTDPRILPAFGAPPLFNNLAPSSHVLTSILSLDSDRLMNSRTRSPFIGNISPLNPFQQSTPFSNNNVLNPLLQNQLLNQQVGNNQNPLLSILNRNGNAGFTPNIGFNQFSQPTPAFLGNQGNFPLINNVLRQQEVCSNTLDLHSNHHNTF